MDDARKAANEKRKALLEQAFNDLDRFNPGQGSEARAALNALRRHERVYGDRW